MGDFQNESLTAKPTQLVSNGLRVHNCFNILSENSTNFNFKIRCSFDFTQKNCFYSHMDKPWMSLAMYTACLMAWSYICMVTCTFVFLINKFMNIHNNNGP